MLQSYFAESIRVLADSGRAWSDHLLAATLECILGAFRAGKPLLVCGNGGSAADAIHITGELVGRFLLERKALPVVCLCSNPSVVTAWANDYSYETIFSRQVEAYGVPGAILLGISTSGNSRNVIAAFDKARTIGMKTIAMTGEGGGLLAERADYLFAVPSRSTPLIQQVHICLYHYLCSEIERQFASAHSCS